MQFRSGAALLMAHACIDARVWQLTGGLQQGWMAMVMHASYDG